MDVGDDEGFQVPGCVRAALVGEGYSLPLDDMEPWVRSWYAWMRGIGTFYDYRERDSFGRVYEVHRRSIMPAMRVCREWGSLLLSDKTAFSTDSQAATDWLQDFSRRTGLMATAQRAVVRAFGLGTGALALWADLGRKEVRVRRYDARMVVPLSWDEDGVTECAFVTRAYLRGKRVDQVQEHVILNGTYHVRTRCFDENGSEVTPEDVIADLDTGSTWPTFALLKPAIDNTRVDLSPYGQSVFADAVDAVQAVDIAYDAIVSEVDVGKMRIFLSDVLFERDDKNDRIASIPFGKFDCRIFRRIQSTEDTIEEFAPALRTSQ